MSVLLLFLLGGLVRVTGSGMGCPDWPRCFGLLAPPGCECQLPHNYQQIFLEKRKAKIERYTKTLDRFGFHSQANAIRNDKSILVPEEFNVAKAWTEYINRIFGVLAGLFALAFAIISVFGRFKRITRLWAISGLIMLVINAWLGSIVVATNLMPGMVTIHFMFSFLCIFFFLISIHHEIPFRSKFPAPKAEARWWAIFILLLTEVFWGTLAREKVELMESGNTMLNGAGMLDYKNMGVNFIFHRFMPAFILILCLVFGYMQSKGNAASGKEFWLFATIVLFQISFGALNIVFVLPDYAQVLHILFGGCMPVWAFYKILQHRKLTVTT